MTKDDFFNDCISHIEKAKAKHPHFVDGVFGKEERTIAGRALIKSQLEASIDSFKRCQGDKAYLYDVLLEECIEFIYECLYNNKKQAYDEACDIVAVLFRQLEKMKGE